MSFILDALKKSEAERQRKSVPGFADIPDAGAKGRQPPWLWLVAALLAVNAAVILGIFYLPDGNEAANPAPLEQTAAVPKHAPSTPAAFSEIVAEARKNRPAEEEPTTTEPQREPARTATAPAPAQASQPAARVTVSENLDTLNELRANGTLQLPELHLDIHVYSDTPAERFVFINMGKYKEGDSLSEGPRVREIRHDGVVLDHNGTRFLMPRQ